MRATRTRAQRTARYACHIVLATCHMTPADRYAFLPRRRYFAASVITPLTIVTPHIVLRHAFVRNTLRFSLDLRHYAAAATVMSALRCWRCHMLYSLYTAPALLHI